MPFTSHLIKIETYEASHYALFYSLLLLPPSYVHLFPSHLSYVVPLGRETTFLITHYSASLRHLIREIQFV